jgi:hypothetical protein
MLGPCGAYLASKDDKTEQELKQNMFISQLTLYDENQEQKPRDSKVLKF